MITDQRVENIWLPQCFQCKQMASEALTAGDSHLGTSGVTQDPKLQGVGKIVHSVKSGNQAGHGGSSL